jgi:hypothetical protein
MKRTIVGTLLALVLVTTSWGQSITTTQQTWIGPPAPPPAGVTAQATVARGSVNLYYWVSARYPSGVSLPAGPGVAIGTLGAANLAKGPVRVNWPAAPGATGYDVIRLTTRNFPANSTCTNCVVSSNQAGITFLDSAGGVVNFPTAGTTFTTGVQLNWVLNNRDDSTPYYTFNGEWHVQPQRSTAAYGYLFKIDDHGGASSGAMTGGVAQKTYAISALVNRPTTAVATGDSNDAIFRGTYNNYAGNDANFVLRGVNTVVTNRSPGTLGWLDNLISVSNRSGATAPYVNGLTVNAENFGTNATQHSGVDVSVKNEAAKATLEFGVRVRNLNNSIAGPSDAAFLVGEPTLVNTGWNFILDANGVKSPTHAFARLQNGAVIYYGSQATRDTVRTEVGTGGAIGSMYMSSTSGKHYIKIANANATADWVLVTTSAAD